MVGKLILTHGGLARELLAAAQVISGRQAPFEALSLDWAAGFEESRATVRDALDRLDQGQGVLILTDAYGTTPCNIAMSFLEPGRIEVLTGVNLPMVLRLSCQAFDEEDLGQVARGLQMKAQRSFCLGSEMVQRKCDNAAPSPAAESKK